ncbi:hypothetical protein CORC01_01243, partial [Colletotrichum orchidophilum]
HTRNPFTAQQTDRQTRQRQQDDRPISQSETPPSTTRASWQAPALKRCQRSPKVYKTPEPGRTATTLLDQSAPSPDAVIPSKGCATKKTSLTGRRTATAIKDTHPRARNPHQALLGYLHVPPPRSPAPASLVLLAPTTPSLPGKTLAHFIPPPSPYQVRSLHTPPTERHSKSTDTEAVDAIRQLLSISNISPKKQR